MIEVKALIIDDSEYKINEVKQVLNELKINDYDTASCITDAYLKIRQEKYDFLISDLGLPRRKGEFVENPLEGLEFLTILINKNINIPTIVFSTTEIPQDSIDYLKETDFHYLGQATDMISLMEELANYLNKFEINSHNKNAR